MLAFMVLLDMITNTVHSVIWPALFLYVTHRIHADTAHTSVCICSGETLSRVLNV